MRQEQKEEEKVKEEFGKEEEDCKSINKKYIYEKIWRHNYITYNDASIRIVRA